MDPLTLTTLAGVIVAAVTSTWLVPVYFRERREARERFDQIMAEVREMKEGPALLRGGVDPRDAVAMREAKKQQRALDRATLEADLIAKYGEAVLGVKALLGPGWDTALDSGLAGAMRVLKPFMDRAQAEASARESSKSVFRPARVE